MTLSIECDVEEAQRGFGNILLFSDIGPDETEQRRNLPAWLAWRRWPRPREGADQTKPAQPQRKTDRRTRSL